MAKATIEPNVSIDDYPDVFELRVKLTEARAELKASEDELAHLHGILNPLLSSSSAAPMPTALDRLRAQQQRPFVEERHLLAKAVVLEIEPAYEHARAEAREQLNEARVQARLPLLRKFAKALEAAAAVGDELRSFDLETVALGGSDPGHPFAQLLDDEPYRQGDASRVRALVEKLERS